MPRAAHVRCFYCNRSLVRRRANSSRWTSCAVTRDHVIPQSHPCFPGDEGNVVTACARCNEARGHAPAILFYLFARSTLQPAPQGSVREVTTAYRRWLFTTRPQQTGGIAA